MIRKTMDGLGNSLRSVLDKVARASVSRTKVQVGIERFVKKVWSRINE